MVNIGKKHGGFHREKVYATSTDKQTQRIHSQIYLQSEHRGTFLLSNDNMCFSNIFKSKIVGFQLLNMKSIYLFCKVIYQLAHNFGAVVLS